MMNVWVLGCLIKKKADIAARLVGLNRSNHLLSVAAANTAAGIFDSRFPIAGST